MEDDTFGDYSCDEFEQQDLQKSSVRVETPLAQNDHNIDENSDKSKVSEKPYEDIDLQMVSVDISAI